MDQEQGSRYKFGGVAAGFFLGWLLMFCSSLAYMLAVPPSYFRDDDVPTFRAGPFGWRVFLLVVTFIASAAVGGAAGAICGRLATALARRGVTDRQLKSGLAVFGGAVGVAISIPGTLTAEALALLASLGAVSGVVLARSVLCSVKASPAPVGPLDESSRARQ
jgi:hypothetical protein